MALKQAFLKCNASETQNQHNW